MEDSKKKKKKGGKVFLTARKRKQPEVAGKETSKEKRIGKKKGGDTSITDFLYFVKKRGDPFLTAESNLKTKHGRDQGGECRMGLHPLQAKKIVFALFNVARGIGKKNLLGKRVQEEKKKKRIGRIHSHTLDRGQEMERKVRDAHFQSLQPEKGHETKKGEREAKDGPLHRRRGKERANRNRHLSPPVSIPMRKGSKRRLTRKEGKGGGLAHFLYVGVRGERRTAATAVLCK